MTDSVPEKIIMSVSIDQAGRAARIEKLLAAGTGQATLRFSGGQTGESNTVPLTLTEEQLIELLYKASLKGVISKDFIGKLREKIEI